MSDNVLMSKLEQEYAKHEDIMFLQCEEGYAGGLLTKKLIASMQEFLARFPRTPFFFKTDDDTFPVLPQIVSRVRQFNGRIIAGVLNTGGHPHRDPRDHWYEPYDVWPESVYPPGPAGGPVMCWMSRRFAI